MVFLAVSPKIQHQFIFIGTHASYGSKSKADSNSNTKNNKKDNANAQKSHEEFIDETVKKLLEKAGSHMEDTLVASYLTLIIGYLILENNEHEEIVRQLMPEKNFSLMVAVLKKFYNFMNLTASVSYYLIKMKNNTIQHYIIRNCTHLFI